jgi:glucose 1-dehydrogenase
MRLPSKIVMITDADSASGLTLIRRFADEGAGLLLNSNSGGRLLLDALEYCRAAGSPTLVTTVNMCSTSEVDSMLEEAKNQLGSIDILIHNQRAVLPMRVETGEESSFLEVMDTNAKTAFICAQVVGRQMAAAQSGVMIFINSIHSEKPTGASFAYSVSQGAVKMLVREAALSLGRCGVRVNSIDMGPVEGDQVLFQSDLSSLYDDYQYKVPSGVLGSYDDLTNCALYLASDAARYVNGADIRLDGGFVLHYLDHKMKKDEPLQTR